MASQMNSQVEVKMSDRQPRGNSDSIVVAVATHKPYRMPDDPLYLPLQVGAALHPELSLDYQRDDSGDNISDRNAYYSELTGLYWMWKNNHAAYKGLVHYRRHFGSLKNRHSSDRFQRIIGLEEMREILASHDIVVAQKRNYYVETIYSHYAHTFHHEQFDLCREVLTEKYPEYVAAWDAEMKATSAHLFNMFVMRSDFFDSYCEWMFSVLAELEKKLDPAEYEDSFQARYLGRVSERLLDPWLQTNGLSYGELPVVSPEPVNWWKKGTGFLLAKFGVKKYDKSF